jgi:hypothetical protein
MKERKFQRRLAAYRSILRCTLDDAVFDVERFGLFQYHEAWAVIHLDKLDFPQYIPHIPTLSPAGVVFQRTYQAGWLAGLPAPDVYQKTRALRHLRWLFEKLSVEQRRELGGE